MLTKSYLESALYLHWIFFRACPLDQVVILNDAPCPEPFKPGPYEENPIRNSKCLRCIWSVELPRRQSKGSLTYAAKMR